MADSQGEQRQRKCETPCSRKLSVIFLSVRGDTDLLKRYPGQAEGPLRQSQDSSVPGQLVVLADCDPLCVLCALTGREAAGG